MNGLHVTYEGENKILRNFFLLITVKIVNE